jgi:hypothetical protein
MDPDKVAESSLLAYMLYQAVLSLNPAEIAVDRPVNRMAQAIAQAEALAHRMHPNGAS